MKGSQHSNDAAHFIDKLKKAGKLQAFVKSLTIYTAIYFYYRGITTLKLNGLEPNDIVQEALVRVLQGRRKWRLPKAVDRNNTRHAVAYLKRYLKGVIRGITGHELKRARVVRSESWLKRNRSVNDEQDVFAPFIENNDSTRLTNKDLCTYFLKYFKKDVEAINVLNAVFNKNIYRTAKIANELNMTGSEVRNIKRRIRRVLKRVGFVEEGGDRGQGPKKSKKRE